MPPQEIVHTPLGPVALTHAPGGLAALRFVDGEAGGVAAGAPSPVAARLAAYFAGDLAALDDIAVVSAGTPFQERVWIALRRLPPGRTATYAELARAIGQPGAVRAVAGANARNPVALVVPCHRVIGSDGTLRGYAHGVARKAWLLAHEGAPPSGGG